MCIMPVIICTVKSAIEYLKEILYLHTKTQFLMAVNGWERNERKKKVQTVHNSIVGQVKNKNSEERTNYSIVYNVYGCHAIDMFWCK